MTSEIIICLGYHYLPQSHVEDTNSAAFGTRKLCHDNIRRDDVQRTEQSAKQQPFHVTEAETDRIQMYPPGPNQNSRYSVTPKQASTKILTGLDAVINIKKIVFWWR